MAVDLDQAQTPQIAGQNRRGLANRTSFEGGRHSGLGPGPGMRRVTKTHTEGKVEVADLTTCPVGVAMVALVVLA